MVKSISFLKQIRLVLNMPEKSGIEKGIGSGGRSMCDLIPYEIDAMKEVVSHKIGLFVGKPYADTDR